MAAMAVELPNITCDKDISDYLQGVKFKNKGESGQGKPFCEFDADGKLRAKLFSDKALTAPSILLIYPV